MTIDHAADSSASASRAALSALNEDVQRELRRGRASGAALSTRLWGILNEIVSDPGETELARLRSGRRFGLLRPQRIRRAITGLVALGYVRRDGDRLVPTVAGIGVVRPFMSLDSQSSQFPALRDMRMRETASSRA